MLPPSTLIFAHTACLAMLSARQGSLRFHSNNGFRSWMPGYTGASEDQSFFLRPPTRQRADPRGYAEAVSVFQSFFYTCRNDIEAHLSDLYCRTSGLLPFCSWPQSWLHFSFALQRHSLLKHYERLLDGPLLVSCRPIIVIAIFLCSAFRNIHNEHHLASGDSHTFRNAFVKLWRNSHKFTVSRHHEFH